jgi:peroxiredoxin Q/BCP
MMTTSVTPSRFTEVLKTRSILFIVAFVVLVSTGAQAFAQSAVGAKVSSNAAAKSEEAAIPPKVGQAAPDFRLPYATLEQVYLKPEEYLALSGLRGKNVILAFYPADWSGGCTKEVCTLRDTFAELAKLNAAVLGVSGDYVFSHHEWAKFHKLQFPLLSDHDHKIARLYGSFNEAVGYNKRTVFLIDKEGVVRYSNLEFKAGDAADYNRLREELTKLK